MRTCPECSNQYEDEVLRCPEDGLPLSGVEPFDELIGRTIGSYRVVKPLGKGGMGAVYLAEHPVIGSRVAIKFLHPQYATDAKIVDRFFNEARAVNLIGHDNILKILDLNVTEDDRHYFIMEFLRGKALQAFVLPNQPMPLEEAGPILVQCCAALQAAHDKGIIHRDLKPDNVHLITHNGRKNFVKVVDFGIAKLTDASGANTNKTQTGLVMGTPAYMSPEQGAGESAKIDGRSDVYSLGVMMYQMATGRLPFPGQNFGEVLMGHLQRRPPPPRSIVPAIPEEYERIILRTLEKNQDDRFQSMSELRDAIRGCMDGLGLSSELPEADEVANVEPPAFAGSPSFPVARTPSRPGRSTDPRAGARPSSVPPRGPGSQPGGRNSNPRVGAARVSNPGRTSPGPRSAPEYATQLAPLPQPARKLPIALGAGAVIVVLLGVIGFLMRDQSAQGAADAAAGQAAKAAAARAVAERARADEAPARVFLSAVSDPPGAEVSATWEGGEKSGPAPLSFEVPKSAKIHLQFRKADCGPSSMDVTADASQAVTALLSCRAKRADMNAALAESSLAPPEPKGEGKGRRRRQEKKPADAPAQRDGLIDLGDAFK